jgi:hypothetical protein
MKAKGQRASKQGLADAGIQTPLLQTADESVIEQPVFSDQEQAIEYAKARACFGSGEICILD